MTVSKYIRNGSCDTPINREILLVEQKKKMYEIQQCFKVKEEIGQYIDFNQYTEK